MAGKFGGLGIQIGNRDGRLIIVSVLPDGPSAKSGLQGNDSIVRIDYVDSDQMSVQDAVSLLRGRAGSKVEITVKRQEKQMVIPLTRGTVHLTSVFPLPSPGRRLEMLRISRFHGETVKELHALLKELNARQLTGLVLDLRGNPGGATDAAIEAASIFLERGTLIAYSLDREQRRHDYKAGRSSRRYIEVPLILLVDNHTASAAEIFAGCMQDWQRATLIGSPTFGKGVGQSVRGFSDGSGMKLTTLSFFTPKDRSLQFHGLQPDIIATPGQEIEIAVWLLRQKEK